MEIDNEIAKIQRQQELQKQLTQLNQGKTTVKDNNFEALLQSIAPLMPQAESKTDVKAMAQSLLSPQETDYKNLSVMNLATVNAVLSGKLDGTKGEEGMQEFEDEILNIATMLDGLEAYGKKLTGSSDKEAWAQLQQIMSAIPGLKEKNLPDELSSIVSEVEILAMSEEFKMNRGDYEQII